MTTFIDLVNIYYKNLQVDGWWEQVLSEKELAHNHELEGHTFIDQKLSECLCISLNSFNTLLNLLIGASNIKNEKEKNQCTRYLNKFILPFIVYGRVENSTNEALPPIDIIRDYLLNEEQSHIKLKLASAILSNYTSTDKDILSIIMEKVKIKDIISIINGAISEEEIDEGKLVLSLEFWINCLNNETFR